MRWRRVALEPSALVWVQLQANLEEEEVEDEDEDEEQAAAGKGKGKLLTTEMLQHLQQAILETKSLGALRRLLMAFQSGCHSTDTVHTWLCYGMRGLLCVVFTGLGKEA